MSNLVEHAKRELALTEEDPEFIKGIIKIVEIFSKMNHSGSSAAHAIVVINELLTFSNLTFLTNNPDEWTNHGNEVWQSKRNSEMFSRDGGRSYYSVNEGPRPLYLCEEYQTEVTK